MTGRNYAEWIGRSEERSDTIVSGPLDRLSATLDRDDPPFADGDMLPPLGHWLFFLPVERQSALGEDGHPRRGDFLPPIHDLPRRMWAGSRISFPGRLRVGEPIARRSSITPVRLKEGVSGPLAFVSVRHEISTGDAEPAIIDEHDIVYRGLGAPAVKQSVPAAPQGEWLRTLSPDAVMLFRYSALTFNGHRIHYDRDYVTKSEGYPGLVVHGPLIATLLVDLARQSQQNAQVVSFSFRAVSPLFDGSPILLNGTRPGEDGVAKLCAANVDGRLAMTAEATLEERAR
jgi:3-methylfumaryl-CoA hydratase